jgi:Flp pilus assembly pilin Flp
MQVFVSTDILSRGKSMKNLKNIQMRAKEFLRRMIEDESGQGATEYILLLVVVVAIAMLFRDKIQTIVSSKIDELNSQIGSFK